MNNVINVNVNIPSGTASQELEVREAVYAFALEMEHELSFHDDDKGEEGWKDAAPENLWHDANVAFTYLKDMLQDGADPTAIRKTAVDAANILMMIADTAGELRG